MNVAVSRFDYRFSGQLGTREIGGPALSASAEEQGESAVFDGGPEDGNYQPGADFSVRMGVAGGRETLGWSDRLSMQHLSQRVGRQEIERGHFGVRTNRSFNLGAEPNVYICRSCRAQPTSAKVSKAEGPWLLLSESGMEVCKGYEIREAFAGKRE